MTSQPARVTELPRCYHCGLPAADDRYTVTIDDALQPVCCPACKAVAETILAGGFGNYYRYRDQPGEQPQADADFASFDRAELQQRWLTVLPDGQVEAELLIGGMHCAACVWLLENYLRRLPGVISVQVNLAEQRAVLRWTAQRQSLSALCRAVAALGYQPQPYSSDSAERLRESEQRRALRRLGVAGIGMMQVGMCALGLYAGAIHGIEPIYRDFLRWVSLLVSVPLVFYCGQSFFSGAWRSIKVGQPGMDVPVALAIALAFAASVWATLRGTGEVYFDSVTMFIFLLLGSRYLELRARHYSGRLSSDLLSLLPATATRVNADGRQEIIALQQLQPGDIALVSAGQYLPADGRLLDAAASVNEAALTGEFMPTPKQRGDALLAGSVNGEQALLLEVSGVGAQLRLSAIHNLSRQVHKPHLALLADRLASHFVAVILVLAALSYLGWHWLEPERAFWIALSVLVVSCPCALGLATPVAITAATSALRRRGLLVTKADAWEKLPTITDVVFDKTGTLSEGRIGIAAVRPCGSRSAAICRDIAAALEAGSSHPIARAFTEQRSVTPAAERRQHAGAGVEGCIAGHRYRLGHARFALELSGQMALLPTEPGHWIALADQRGALCWFRLDDRTRSDAAAVIGALKQRGCTVHLLSGDRSQAVAALAAELGIERAVAGATPERKLDYLAQLQRAGRRVLMVGDGINDIPVLAAADVSVAMNNASQLAKTHADCILLAPRLDRLPALLDGALKTRRVIYQNLGWALLYNVFAVPMAAAGWVPPWLAAVGMSLSSLLVVGNALRLQRLSAVEFE